MFETELNYFIAHQDELVAKYRGKVLVLVGESVVDAHDTFKAAYLGAQESYALGEFMLQPCEPGPEAYTITVATTCAE